MQAWYVRHVLLKCRYQNVYGGRALEDEEITGLLIAVIFAGQHTSSITTSWTGLFMNANKVLHAYTYLRMQQILQPIHTERHMALLTDT